MFLTSIRALVTRPALQSESLVKEIQSKLGEAWVFPLLEINPLPDSGANREILMALDQFDKVIVTSHNAAEYGVNLIKKYCMKLPTSLDWYAIGPKTASILLRYSIKAKIPCEGFDSESLLAMDSLAHIQNKKILIIKGVGGRILLEQTLEARGGDIQCLLSYQRQMPAYSLERLPNLLKKKQINTIVCTSGAVIDNLLTILPTSEVVSLYLIVPSQRVANQIVNIPFRQVIVAKGASDNAMLSALTALQLQQEALSKLTKHSEELL